MTSPVTIPTLYKMEEKGEKDVVLKPLVEGTLANVDRMGVHQVLTGPVVCGDVQTVQTHIQAICQTLPELLPFYLRGALHGGSSRRRGTDFIGSGESFSGTDTSD